VTVINNYTKTFFRRRGLLAVIYILVVIVARDGGDGRRLHVPSVVLKFIMSKLSKVFPLGSTTLVTYSTL
jgi:hypothetical protein